MKPANAIIALFIITMALLPCGDVVATDTSSGIESAVAGRNSQSDDGHSDSDDCTPFCECLCCHTPVIPAPHLLNSAHTPAHFDEGSFGYYQEFFPNGVSHSIWHPPKFV